MIRILRSLALAGSLLFASPAGAQGLDLIPHSCDELGRCCQRWIIDLHKADRTIWGVQSGVDLAGARQALEDAQTFESRWCRMIGKSTPCSDFNHANPGTPRCDALVATEPDACFSDTARRIEDLEKRVAEQNVLTAGAAALDPLQVIAADVLRRPTDQLKSLGQATRSYGNTLKDAVGRLKELRKSYDQLCSPLGQSVEKFWSDIDAGRFDGRGEHARASRKIRGELREIETTFGHGADILDTAIPAVESKIAGTISQKSVTGEGRLIGLGAVGSTLRPSTHPVAYFYVDGNGELRTGTVKITRRASAAGDVIVVVGSANGVGEQTFEILPAADRDRDGVKDADDECPDEKGPVSEGGCPEPVQTPFASRTPLAQKPKATTLGPGSIQVTMGGVYGIKDKAHIDLGGRTGTVQVTLEAEHLGSVPIRLRVDCHHTESSDGLCLYYVTYQTAGNRGELFQLPKVATGTSVQLEIRCNETICQWTRAY